GERPEQHRERIAQRLRLKRCGETFVQALEPLDISFLSHTHGGTSGGFGPSEPPVDLLLDLLACKPQTAKFLVQLTLTALRKVSEGGCRCRPPQSRPSAEDVASDGRSVETDGAEPSHKLDMAVDQGALVLFSNDGSNFLDACFDLSILRPR